MDFKDVVKMIEESNKKVDEVLKAAKLERHERQPMSDKRFEFICYFVAGMVAMVMAFTAVCMIIYFAGR